MRLVFLLVFAAATAVAYAQDSPRKTREAAAAFLAAIPEAQRAKAQRPFDDADRIDWHFTPRSRNGVSFKEMDARGRALGEEHDAGWALLEAMSDAQKRGAVIEARTYGDIVSGNRDAVEPLAPRGLSAAKLDERQRALLWKIVEVYAGSFEPGLAKARLARAREGGIEALSFAWAGSVARGKPHYYRIQGPQVLIEYDASQNDGNHIHTVWRDFKGDFGRDLLREHYLKKHR